PGQRAYEPMFLDERDEIDGRNQTVLRVPPAHEGLDAGNGARRNPHLGLVVDLELAAVDRAVEFLHRISSPGTCTASGPQILPVEHFPQPLGLHRLGDSAEDGKVVRLCEASGGLNDAVLLPAYQHHAALVADLDQV